MTYQQEAMRTASPLEADPEDYIDLGCLVRALEVGLKAKVLKAHLYYENWDENYRDRVVAEVQEHIGDTSKLGKKIYGVIVCKRNELTVSDPCLHALLGMIDEVGELVEEVFAAYTRGKDIDKDALCEELGDLEWFMSLMRQDAGLTQEEVQQANIRKLKARYPIAPEKPEDFERRNQDAESEAMNDA